MRGGEGRRPTIAIWIALLGAALAVRIWGGQTLLITQSSMEPTLWAGDRVWMWNHRGDPVPPGALIAWSEPGEGGLLVGRVVAHGGQRVELVKGRLWISGELATEGTEETVQTLDSNCQPQTRHARLERWGDTVAPVLPAGDHEAVDIPPDHYFVLLDRRSLPGDSRQWGTITSDQIEGRLSRILWSTPLCQTSISPTRTGLQLR